MFITTFPAGWSPQMVVKSKIPPKNALNSGLGIIVICPDHSLEYQDIQIKPLFLRKLTIREPRKSVEKIRVKNLENDHTYTLEN